jgi:CRISPR-associated protein Cmr2
MPDQEFWKRKLMAYLHDPPDKCFDIGRHEEAATSFMTGAGFADEEERKRILAEIKSADHFSASAERFVFPKGKCPTAYNGQRGSCFIHPISSTQYIAPDNLKEQAGHLHEILKSAVGGIETDDWRCKFFLYWRRWMENAVTSDKQNAEHLAFSPAYSRIPDHSIWNHMSITSALAGCIEDDKLRPTLLLFQLGPVQDFIAQSRSTRDLWSGSYLLSWLIAHAMKAVSDKVGPDSIIFPNLRGNGIFDALHREEMYGIMWDDKHGSKMSTWDRMKQDKGKDRVANWLLTPTLPNRFLALVPETQSEKLAKFAEEAIRSEIRSELKNIGDAVWNWISKEAEKAGCTGIDNWKKRWNCQIEAFPQITWAVQPWLDRDKCLAEFAKLPVNDKDRKENGKPLVTPFQRLQDMLDFGEKWLPVENRDPRYYSDSDKNDPKKGKTKLNNPGILWSAHYALVDAKLAARRNTRDFTAWKMEDGKTKNGTPKDSLSGKEEIIGDEQFWKYLVKEYPKLFKSPGHRYGAMNLIKRLWCRSDKTPYLCDKTGLTEKEFNTAVGFETVEEIANKNQYGGKYVAILAMDGDDMGKWVSGEKTPEFLKQISEKAREYLEPILKKQGKTDLRRMLTPSYHLQFSEALANFATWLAEPIVSEFDGQLIYAGGDDVLVMLPADKAIACAEALRAVFRGEEPAEHFKLKLVVTQSGFVMENAGYPLIVPGEKTDVSIGLAIGHCNAPLQMLVREAQKAEKRAKKEYGKGAIAMSVYKRSGEIIEWGCKWDDGEKFVGLKLMKKTTEYSTVDNAQLSGRFPYALAQLLKPYGLESQKCESISKLDKPKMTSIDKNDLKKIILKEFEHVVRQQGKDLPGDDKAKFISLAGKWLEQTQDKLDDFAKLFLVETFINRHREEA